MAFHLAGFQGKNGMMLISVISRPPGNFSIFSISTMLFTFQYSFHFKLLFHLSKTMPFPSPNHRWRSLFLNCHFRWLQGFSAKSSFEKFCLWRNGKTNRVSNRHHHQGGNVDGSIKQPFRTLPTHFFTWLYRQYDLTEIIGDRIMYF